jgi:hypothetical protein
MSATDDIVMPTSFDWESEDKLKKRNEIDLAVPSKESIEQILKKYDDFARFVLWCDEKLSSLEFCLENFHSFSKEELDFDLGCEFNYVYHRYKTRFLNRFLAFLSKTPTYRSQIVEKMRSVYGKELFLDCYEPMKNFDKFFIADANVITNYLNSSFDERISLINNAEEGLRNDKEDPEFFRGKLDPADSIP